ncbi:hypothetical protein PFISCL1PPCAC_7501, partial [Pristionchus fissidentatus]
EEEEEGGEKYESNDTSLTVKNSYNAHESNKTVQNKTNITYRFFEDFNLIRTLGSGSYGCVFEAEKILENMVYAVKRVQLQKSPDAEPAEHEKKLTKAWMEVTTMAKLNHRGIVRYYNAWIEEPTPCDVFVYIQMQLCTSTLKEWLKANQKPRDMGRMKAWMKQLLEAVAYIHEKNFIHRDLKPSNILFDGEDELKICDLGIAAAFEIRDDGKEATNTRTMGKGTSLYMSPEQSFWLYKSAVDVFTLGLIFAEISVPMKGAGRKQIFANYRTGMPNYILMDAATKELIEWMTTVDSDDRPSSRQVLHSRFFSD